MGDMKAKFIKIAGLAITLVAFGSIYTAGLHAQQTTKKSSLLPVTTNWVGCLVVGRNETIDPHLAPGPHPTSVGQVELGLRSDGVVVWRAKPKPQ
jgi:hypothetical protein